MATGAIPPQFIITGAESAGAYGAIRSFPQSFINVYRYVYAGSLRTVWYVCTGIAGAGLLASLLVRNESMDQGNKSKQAFKIEKEVEKGSSDAMV